MLAPAAALLALALAGCGAATGGGSPTSSSGVVAGASGGPAPRGQQLAAASGRTTGATRAGRGGGATGATGAKGATRAGRGGGATGAKPQAGWRTSSSSNALKASRATSIDVSRDSGSTLVASTGGTIGVSDSGTAGKPATSTTAAPPHTDTHRPTKPTAAGAPGSGHATAPPASTGAKKTAAKAGVRARRGPSVPAGAFAPSRRPLLGLSAFMVTGGNLGCELERTGVRCGIVRRVWAPPSEPRHCTTLWGSIVTLARSDGAKFTCAHHPLTIGSAQVVPNGWDDQVGGFTCQVRAFGVDCFAADHRGFIISRTGYMFY